MTLKTLTLTSSIWIWVLGFLVSGTWAYPSPTTSTSSCHVWKAHQQKAALLWRVSSAPPSHAQGAESCTGGLGEDWRRQPAHRHRHTQPDAEKRPPAGPHPPCAHTVCPPPLRLEMEEHQEQKQQFHNQLLCTRLLTPNLSMTCHFNIL